MALLESQIDEIVKEYQNNAKVADLAKKYETSAQLISYHLRKRGVQRPSTHLPPTLVKEIGQMISTGMTLKEISTRLDIPYQKIYSVCNYRGWVSEANHSRVWEDYAKDLGALAEYQRILDESPKVVAEKKKVKKVEYQGKKYLDLTDLYT